MLITFENSIIKDLNQFSDEVLKKYNISVENKEFYMIPIDINYFYMIVNKQGNLSFGFESDHHKYLNIEHRSSGGGGIDYDNPRSLQTFELSTRDNVPLVDVDGVFHEIPIPIVTRNIYMQPENDEEEKMLQGKLVTYSRYTHHATMIPWEHITPDFEDDDVIKEVKEGDDIIYGYEFKK